MTSNMHQDSRATVGHHAQFLSSIRKACASFRLSRRRADKAGERDGKHVCLPPACSPPRETTFRLRLKISTGTRQFVDLRLSGHSQAPDIPRSVSERTSKQGADAF